MKRSLVLVAALAALLAGCGGETTTPDNQSTLLVYGNHGALKQVTEESYHNEVDFKAGWDKAYAGQTEPALPTVDFTKNTVAMYAIGEMKHGGYQIRVLRALPVTGANYAMGFQVVVPGLGCHNETQEITRPFIFVMVPTTGDIDFDNVNKRETPSCTAK